MEKEIEVSYESFGASEVSYGEVMQLLKACQSFENDKDCNEHVASWVERKKKHSQS